MAKKATTTITIEIEFKEKITEEQIQEIVDDIAIEVSFRHNELPLLANKKVESVWINADDECPDWDIEDAE